MQNLYRRYHLKNQFQIEAVDLQKDVGFAAKVFKTSLFMESSEKPFCTFIIKVPNKEWYEKLMAKMQGAENQGKVIFN